MVEETVMLEGEEIPPEMLAFLKDQQEKQREEDQRRLDALGAKIAKIRDEAVAARRESGFEKIWLEDEEFYNGIDDKNRASTTYLKPRSISGGLVKSSNEPTNNDCIEFFNITRPFTDAAESRVGDMLLPQNDWPFHIKPTPVPEFDKHIDDDRPMILGQDGNPISVGNVIKDRNKEVSESVEKAEQTIKDWLIECNYKRECRKAIAGAVQVGTGILKGPFPEKRSYRMVKDGTLQITEVISPVTRHISHWDFFPDMNCGEDIQEGDYVIERDYLTARQLRNLKGTPGYLDDAIDKVLKEGPGQIIIDSTNGARKLEDSDRFEIWYFNGSVDGKDISLLDDDVDCEERDPINSIVVLVNSTVIKGVRSPLEESGYPYDLMTWKRIPGQPFGVGVPREGRVAQKTVLASFRTLMKNMGLAAVPMLALLRSALDPVQNGNYELYAGKQWIINEDSGVKNANEAIQSIIIPPMQEPLTALIQLGSKMMEDSTGITFLMQGQQGSAPDTVGGMMMMLQSSSTVLRNVVRKFDEVTKSQITRYYDWLLMYGEDDQKADLTIEAIGSASLAEREMQAMNLPTILQFAMNPAFGKSPTKVLDEWLRAMKFEPSKFDLDEEEKQAMAQQQAPSDPRIEVANINAQKDLQLAQDKNQIELARIKKDQDRDAIFAAGVTERTQTDRQSHLEELQLKRDLAILQYATEQNMQLSDIKAKLSSDAMKLSVQKELAHIDNEATPVLTPPTEPPGRAETGKSFQQ